MIDGMVNEVGILLLLATPNKRGVSSKASSSPNNDSSNCQWHRGQLQVQDHSYNRHEIQYFSIFPTRVTAAGEALLVLLKNGMSAPVSHERQAVQDVALNLARDVQM